MIFIKTGLLYNLATTVRCSSLVLTTWTRAYSSYFTSTTTISLPSPKLAGGRRTDVLWQERHSGHSDPDCEFMLTGIWEFSRYVRLLNQVDHSPAGTIRSIKSESFYSGKEIFPSLFSLESHLRLAWERLRSPSTVGLKIAVPIFMLALRLTNHSVLLANPIKCHFPAIFSKETIIKSSYFVFKGFLCMYLKCIHTK